MKSIYTIVLAFLYLICPGYHTIAQKPTYTWARSAVTFGGSVNVKSMGTDEMGNSYALGFSRNGIDFGSPSGPPDAIFLVKHSPQGNPVWVLHAKGSPYALAVDPAGNAYITGSFMDTLNLGGHVLVCRGKVDAFVAKVDSSGSVVWVKQSGSIGYHPLMPPMPPIMEDEGVSIGVDTAGNCYVGAMVVASDTSAAIFDTISVLPPNSSLFPRRFNVLAKYNPAGDIQWAKPVFNSNSSYFINQSITISNVGECFISGSYRDTLNYGTNRLVSNGAEDICLASYDLNGNLQWTQSFGGTGSDRISDIATDKQGNILLTGSFQDSIQIGATTLIKQHGSSSQRSTLFLAKFNSNGNAIWASQANGAGRAGDSQLAIDDSGNNYLISTFANTVIIGLYQFTSISASEDVLVSKWDSLGNAIWAVASQGGGNDFSGGISLDSSGTFCYVAGSFEGGLNFGNIQLSSSNSNFFLARLDHIVSSIPAQMQAAGPMVYPNPASGAFHVALPNGNINKGRFMLYSVTGQLMKEVKFSDISDFTIERENLPAGLYVYRIVSDDSVAVTGKLILE